LLGGTAPQPSTNVFYLLTVANYQRDFPDEVVQSSTVVFHIYGVFVIQLPQSTDISSNSGLHLGSPGLHGRGEKLFPQSTATGPEPQLALVGGHGAVKLPQSTPTLQSFTPGGHAGTARLPQSTPTPFGAALWVISPSEITINAKTMTNATNAQLLPQLIEQCVDCISLFSFRAS
jgi:hypothetical protein